MMAPPRRIIHVWKALLSVAILVQRGESIRFLSRDKACVISSQQEEAPTNIHCHADTPPLAQLPSVVVGEQHSLLQSLLRPIRVGIFRASQSNSVHILQRAFHHQQPTVGNHLERVVSSLVNKPRGGSQVKTKPRPSKTLPEKEARNTKKKPLHESPLSASTPFFPTELISDMTLSDVARVFEYATKSTQSSFDPLQFMNDVEPRIQNALQAMDMACAKSRGPNVRIQKLDRSPQDDPSSRPGDMDTFNFCAAMRLLTEWRMLRQVPEGFASFAVSMKMGHRDVCKNLAKIEEAAHYYIDYQRQDKGHDDVDVLSPTLRDLLQFEVDTNVHPSLPRLTEVSGAMGLLWVRRQLHFQLAFFENGINIKKFPRASDAYQAAYAQVYQNYHGRTIALIFNKSLNAAPELHEVYKCMNPHRLKQVASAPMEVIAASLRPAQDKQKEVGSAKSFGFVRPSSVTAPEVPPTETDTDTLDDHVVQQWITREMEKDANDHIKTFLGVTQPLLCDLADVIDEFNMNDPKKV